MSGRRPALDGLRAVAALAVLATHVAFVSGFTADAPLGPLTGRLNVGVALFFALSGFLLYRPWVAARLDGRPAPAPRTYALRRVARIFPAYWLALLVLAVALPDEVKGPFGDDWWRYWSLLQVYSVDTILGGIAIAWSLGTELTFYLLLPLLAWLAARALGRLPRERQVRAELTVLLVSAPVALVLAALVAGDGPSIVPNTVLGKWPWFVVGLSLAVADVAWAARPVAERPAALRLLARHGGWVMAAGAALLVLVAYAGVLPRVALFSTAGEIRVETVVFTVVAACLLAPVVLADPDRAVAPVRALAARPVAWLGLVSYGLFLWHYPIAAAMTGHGLPLVALVVLGLALPAAAASWYVVERPVLRRVHHRP